MKKRSGSTAAAQRPAAVPKRRMSAHTLPDAANAVFLVGFMGAGKSSVGRALGRQLNWTFEDLDHRIERREGRTIAEIFRESGEPEFRKAERAALQQVLKETNQGLARIVALGGGAFVQKGNAGLLEAAGVPTVFLDAPVEELWRRCRMQASEDGMERPLLRSLEQFRALYETRRQGYLKASLTVETAGHRVEAVAAKIAESLGLKRIQSRKEQGEAE